MVVSPTSVTLYLNGVPATHANLTLDKVNFSSNSQLGSYKSWGGKYFKGQLDEVCVYNKSLTQNEIREKMHLVKSPSVEPVLIAYFQFNEELGSSIFDRARTHHAHLGGSAQRVTSTVAVGPGASKRLNCTTGGSKNFGAGVDVVTTFPNTGTYPAGEVCITRIQLTPDVLPTNAPHSPSYWVIRNYGSNPVFSQLTSIRFMKIGNVPAITNPSQHKLYQRAANGEGNTWQLQDFGDARAAGSNGAVTFILNNGFTSFNSQFIIAKPAAAKNLLEIDTLLPSKIRIEVPVHTFEAGVSPNPVPTGGDFKSVPTLPKRSISSCSIARVEPCACKNLRGQSKSQQKDYPQATIFILLKINCL